MVSPYGTWYEFKVLVTNGKRKSSKKLKLEVKDFTVYPVAISPVVKKGVSYASDGQLYVATNVDFFLEGSVVGAGVSAAPAGGWIYRWSCGI